MKLVRAFRGAIQIEEDSSQVMRVAVKELLLGLLGENQIEESDLISIFFTSTPDLTSEFPAAAARAMGIIDVPLICASEIAVKGALPRTIRIMLHAYSVLEREAISHQYLRGASVLRPDVASQKDSNA